MRHRNARAIGIAVVVTGLALALSMSANAQGLLKVGDEAPAFPNPLPSSAGEKPGEVQLSLKDVIGKKNIVLAFYVADWTGG